MMRKSWQCIQFGHYEQDYNLMKFKKRKGYKEAQSTGNKPSNKEKGDVYLEFTSTQLDHDSWLIDSSVSFHITPCKEWFYEYEKFKGCGIILGDYSMTKFVR